MAGTAGLKSRRTDGIIMVALAAIYGVLAFLVFCSSGLFGIFGRNGWRDAALVLVTITASCALAYISMLYYARLRYIPNTSGDPEDLDWHFLIPCRDEESVIAATISAARTSFPFAHVWVIDDASTDGTAAVVERAMAFDGNVHIIRRTAPDARIGKGEALNYAYRVLSGHVGPDPARRAKTVVAILDADGYLSDDALAYLAGPESFGDSRVGAAQLEVWMKNRGDKRPLPQRGRTANLLSRYLVRMQDLEFRATNSSMQLLRVRTGSVGMGGNGQFTRLTALDLVAENFDGKPWGNKLAEDYELGLRILGLGLRNHYVPEGHVSQEAVPSLRRLLTQRTRWSQGNLECISMLPALRRAGTVGVSGTLEIHYFMAQPLIMMSNLVLLPVLTFLAVLEGQFGFLGGTGMLLTVAAGVAFLLLPYAGWGPVYRSETRHEGRGFGGLAVGLGALIYVYATYLYYPRAIARLLSGRSTWAKTARNADGRGVRALTGLFPLQGRPVLDPAVLAGLGEELGSDKLANDFAKAFAVMWPRRMERLEQAVSAENFDASRDAAGSIRTSAAMVGAAQLEAAGTTIQDWVLGHDFNTSRNGLDEMRLLGEMSLDALRERQPAID